MKQTINLILLVTLTLLFSCQKDGQEYLDEHKNELFQVSALSDSIPADGKSTLMLTVQLNSKTNIADYKTVTFSTNKGSFAENGEKNFATEAALVNGKLMAFANLTSTQATADLVIVKISVPKIDTTLYINFFTAKPDSIRSESILSIISNNYDAEVPLTTYLIRKKGLPSLGQQVAYTAINDNNLPIGYFRGIVPSGSDSSGLLKSIFVLRDSTYTGKVRIMAKMQGVDKILTDVVTVNIKKK